MSRRAVAIRSDVAKAMLALLILLCAPAPAARAGLADDLIESVKTVAEEARQSARQARDTAQETRNEMRDGISSIAGNVRETINETTDELKDNLDDLRDGREDFIDARADAFRGDVLAFIENLQNVSNQLFAIGGLGEDRIDFERTRRAISNAPPLVLFPLSRAFDESLDLFGSPFAVRLQEAAIDLEELVGAWTEQARETACDLLLRGNPEAPDPDAQALNEIRILEMKATAIGSKMVGKAIRSVATTTTSKEGAVWGWVGFSLTTNRLKKLGLGVESLGESLGTFAGNMSDRLEACVAAEQGDEILEKLAGFDPVLASIENRLMAVELRVEESIRLLKTPPGKRDGFSGN